MSETGAHQQYPEYATDQYVQPTAKPTPRSRNLRGNSITGALTGIKAVISPRHDITAPTTVPMSKYATTAPPGPPRARIIPLPRNNPTGRRVRNTIQNSIPIQHISHSPFPMVLKRVRSRLACATYCRVQRLAYPEKAIICQQLAMLSIQYIHM